MKTTLWCNRYDTVERLISEYAKEHEDISPSKDALHSVVVEDLDYQLEDLREMLDVEVGQIVALGELNLWNGKVYGYADVGTNLKDVLNSDCDYITWGMDAYNLKAIASHHDGTNYYTYRMLKEDLSDTQIDNFYDKAYEGKLTTQDISRYTKSLKPIVEKTW